MPGVFSTDPARLLDELKRTAVEQLGAVPGGLYRPIEEQLHDNLRSGTGGAHRRDLMTVLALRQRGASFVMRYRELVARSFDDFRGRAFAARPNLPLGLVRENELDFHLAGQRLAESIGRRFQRPLEMLDLRFESLGNALGAPPTSNPIGATRLAGAFLQTFRDADISDTLQPLLFRQYEQELAKVLGDLYGRLNTQLASAGFHADLRRLSQADGGAAPAAGRAPSPAQSAGADLFRVSAEARVQHQRLREQLRSWRHVAAPADAAHATRRELRVQELVSVASLMQRDAARPFEQALAGQGGLNLVIRKQLFEGGRCLGLDPDGTRLAEQQEDAIDLVGLMFESLIGTHALVEQARTMFARLVMSYVKVALTDENLFVRPDHPARRLLDAVALSCESNDGASPQDRELLERAGAAVNRVVAEYNEDLAIFEVAANELHDLLQQQRRRAEVVERRSAETVHGRERLLQARLQAAALLGQRMGGRELTPVIGQFLEEHWQHHLVQVLLREGQASEQHATALLLADQLLALDESAARGEGGGVASSVLEMQAALVACLRSSGLEPKVADEWMAALARTLAFPDTPRGERTLPEMPQLADDSDDTRLLQVVGGNAGLDYDPDVAEHLRTLPPGSWMRLVDETGEEGSVKVAWISPLTSRLLLVNRRGVRKLVASPEQLAVLARKGRLLPDAADLPFDEAMRQVRQRLGENARAA